MITFQIDVSRTYRNKEGYQVGGYKLNTSFQTETHNPKTFIEQVVKPGWPYTMVHLKRSPKETGAAARGVSTPKHVENFVSRQELTGDDDSKAPGVVEFWRNDDPWFKANGFAFVESVNSIPGEAEKGHPTIILDRPITDPEIYKAAAKALAWRYPRLDSGIHNIDRTIYNAQGARVHLLGNICKWEAFNRDILQPYLAHLAEQQVREEARRLKLQAEREELPQSDDRLEEYARRSIQGILDRVATARDGERHNIIRWAGVALGGLKAADWVKPGLLDYIAEDVLKAAQQAGGYDDPEILRTFEWGFTTGQNRPAEKPTFYEPAPRTGKNTVDNIHNYFTQPEPKKERPGKLTPLTFSNAIKTPEIEKCEIAAEHYTWTAEGGKGTTFFYCNDPERCALCRRRHAIKLKYYLEEVAQLAYVDENDNAAYARPKLNEFDMLVTPWALGPGFWYARLLNKDERRAFSARYKRTKPGGFIKPEIYPVLDGDELKYVALSLTAFEDMQPVELTEDLLERIATGAPAARSSLLFCPPRKQLERALPRYTFEIPQYLHERGIVATVAAPHSILFTGPVKSEAIYDSFDTRAKTFDEIALILEEIALKSIDEDRLRGVDDHAPDYVIQSIHIVEEAKQAYLKVYNAGLAGDQVTLKRYKRSDLPKLPTFKNPCVDKSIYPKFYIDLSTHKPIENDESPGYYARLEYLLETEAI